MLSASASVPGVSTSLPSRGAWIEIPLLEAHGVHTMSLPSRGAWIEMVMALLNVPEIYGRSPRGERGLK